MQRIGFIGAGNMGRRMARRLLDAGHELIVCDRNPGILAEFEALGARVTRIPGECAKADFVIVMVANGEQFRDAALGPDGLTVHAGPGDAPLVAVMSTVLPRDVIEAGAGLSARGMSLIDAPVSGGLVGAERGTLSILVGGAEADIERATPVLRILGQNVLRCGKLGSGELVKILNQAIGLTTLYLLPEVLHLSLHNGLDVAGVASVLEKSSGRNQFSHDGELIPRHYDAFTRDSGGFESISDIARKDFTLIGELAREAGMRLPFFEGLARALTVASGERVTFDHWRAVAESDGALTTGR
jgi:3-hydroxyisobutyrate dehydrogenase